MDDWYQRYVSTKDFESRSATEIEQIMKLSNIKYILVKNSNYKKFDESDTFKVFLTCGSDSYRIYNINENHQTNGS